MKGRVALAIGDGHTLHARPESLGSVQEEPGGLRVYVGDRWLWIAGMTAADLDTAMQTAESEVAQAGTAALASPAVVE